VERAATRRDRAHEPAHGSDGNRRRRRPRRQRLACRPACRRQARQAPAATDPLGSDRLVAEPSLDLVIERALVVEETSRLLARAVQELPGGAEPREDEVGRAGLAPAEELSPTPDLEVDLGELEAVARGDKRFQPSTRRVGELLLGAGDEQAVGLLGAAPDPTAQL